MPNDGPNNDQTPDDAHALSLGDLLFETVWFTVAIVSAVAVLGYFFRAPLESMARWLVDTLGYVGLFGGVFAADAFTVPIPPDFYLLISIAGGSHVMLTLLACSAASVIGGNVAYALGPFIERLPLLRQRLDDYRPRGEYLFQTWGGWAVGVAAMTPVPFSIVSWLAGIYEMRYSAYLAASLCRVPRIVGYYALYAYGWAPSAL